MRITTAKDRPETIDVKKLYIDFCKQYSSVFIEDFEEDGVFIYHSLGRADYKRLVTDENTSLCDKEEIICEACVVWPENYDFENCENAGLPSKLAKKILEQSYLDKPENLQNMIHYFRDKINNSINDQISCAIHEAFPEFPVDDIDNWDVAKTAEYMARAEFILHSLRGVPLNPMAEVPAESQIPQERPVPIRNAKTTEIKDESNISAKKRDRKLTPEKLAELQAKFPEIDWAHDSGFQSFDGFQNHIKGAQIDTRRRGEIPIDGSEEGQNALPLAMRDRFKVISSHDVIEKD